MIDDDVNDDDDDDDCEAVGGMQICRGSRSTHENLPQPFELTATESESESYVTTNGQSASLS
jgi:hypothetical protein